jgi:hypothetical protein
MTIEGFNTTGFMVALHTVESGIPQRREPMRSIGNGSICAISPRIFIREDRSIWSGHEAASECRLSPCDPW